jgi:hypothetical protein
MTFDEAVAELRALSQHSVDAVVRGYAEQSKVTVAEWLSKCTVDVSYRVVRGILGEEVVMECKARKR